jgi:hypothetical protein
VKNTINRVVNLLLYLLLCFMLGTGLLMWLRLPPGSRGGGGHLTVMGLNRHAWGDWHLWAALAFVALSVAHLVMNWVWMMKIAGSKRAWRVWLGIGAGLAIVTILALLPVDAR